MSRKYFGTDGVRGRVGQTPITPEFAMLLAQAAGRILKQQTTDGEVGVFIGKDTRVSGYMLEAALQAGFLSAGVDVMLGGPLPTPAVAYLTRAQRLSAGVSSPPLIIPSMTTALSFSRTKAPSCLMKWNCRLKKKWTAVSAV